MTEPQASLVGYGDVTPRPLPPWLSHEPPSKVTLIRHCWVLVDGERLPGLLLSRRQAGSSWEGRVIVPQLVDGKWIPHEGWLPAEQIELA